MFDLFRAMKFGLAIIAASIILVSGSSLSQAQTGSVRFTIAKAGFIVGVGGGTGTLTYRGRHYRLRIGGISAGTIGVARADLVGTASHLRDAQDIAGAYTAVAAGFAIVGGRKVARLQNSNGVVLELHGRQVGFDLSLDLSGLNISIQ